MIKCLLSELHRTLKVMSVVLDEPVTSVLKGRQEYYYIGQVLIGCEKGLTTSMIPVPWEDRYKSDRVYIYPAFLEEAEEIQTTEAKIEVMYQQTKMRNRQCFH